MWLFCCSCWISAPTCLFFVSSSPVVSVFLKLPPLTLSFLRSSLAVSRKQTRTLRCGLRYTGLAPRPCSQCITKPPPSDALSRSITLHPSRRAISPPLLACCCFCWHTRYHGAQLSDHSLLPDFTPHAAAKSCRRWLCSSSVSVRNRINVYFSTYFTVNGRFDLPPLSHFTAAPSFS